MRYTICNGRLHGDNFDHIKRSLTFYWDNNENIDRPKKVDWNIWNITCGRFSVALVPLPKWLVRSKFQEVGWHQAHRNMVQWNQAEACSSTRSLIIKILFEFLIKKSVWVWHGELLFEEKRLATHLLFKHNEELLTTGKLPYWIFVNHKINQTYTLSWFYELVDYFWNYYYEINFTNNSIIVENLFKCCWTFIQRQNQDI